MTKKHNDSFSFLSPRLTIKNNHLTKRDVFKIKASLAQKIGAASLLVGIAFVLICVVLILSFNSKSNWHYIEVYGFSSMLGQSIGGGLSLVSIGFEIGSLLTKDKKKKILLARLAIDILFIAIAFNMFGSFFADAKMGYLSNSPTMSVSIILLSILLVIKPVYWTEAIPFDLLVTALMISFAYICEAKFAIQSTLYYVLIAIAYPGLSYLVASILFYAETQRYIQDLRNASLYNTALYDELTHCKNRFALKEFLNENTRRWENKETNILLVMFDIDAFKEYNDTFSHQGGDYCLVTISQAIRRAFPSPDLSFFRYGGEEFLLFFEPENISEARKILEKVRKTVQNLKIEAPKEAPDKYVTISVGGTFIRTMGKFNFDQTLKATDEYLYQAKNEGKNICVINGSTIN